eukprot:10161963-Ditylum_brightwellii.AAC.1
MIRSSVEAEVYATDKYVKMLLHINNILTDMGLKETIMGQTTRIFNGNQVCVNWAKNMTSKGLCHIQMQENAIKEAVQTGFASIEHVNEKINLSNIFTEEDKDRAHFLTL